jgi:histidinol dehydrogenase
VTTREELAKEVIAESKAQSRGNAVAREALDRNGIAIGAGTIAQAREITNRLAPEHLTVDSAEDLSWVRSAGSVFVGGWSAQPMGDYISGPNHTLPTGGIARVRGGLSVNDFVKLVTVQEYSAEGIGKLGPKAALLADAEGLAAHAASIRMREKKASRRKTTTRTRRVRG